MNHPYVQETLLGHSTCGTIIQFLKLCHNYYYYSAVFQQLYEFPVLDHNNNHTTAKLDVCVGECIHVRVCVYVSECVCEYI